MNNIEQDSQMMEVTHPVNTIVHIPFFSTEKYLGTYYSWMFQPVLRYVLITSLKDVEGKPFHAN